MFLVELLQASTVDANGTARDSNGNVIENLRVKSVTNYEYETDINDLKRAIIIPKKTYIGTFISDIEEIMSYDPQASESLNRFIKGVSNWRFTGQ